MENIDIKDRTLNNGLRLITINKKGSLMSLNLGFTGGSVEDEENKKGITHFLEHMIFNGTKTRSHDELNEELEFLGGDIDAYTDIDNLILSITALNTELKNSINLISDMVRNSVFLDKEIEKEKKVVLSEYREGQDDLETITFDKLYNLAFKGDKLKYNVIGTENTIKSFTYDDLIKRKNELLIPNRAVLVIVSDNNHDDVLNLVDSYFGTWEKQNINTKEIVRINNNSGIFNSKNSNFEMGSVSQIYTFKDLPKSYEMPLKILNHKLGNSDNSLLFKEVRLKRGLAYDIYSNLELSNSLKALEIYCSVDSKEVNTVNNIINKTIDDLKTGVNLIENKTLTLMKKIYKTNFSNLIDDTYSLGTYILSNALENKELLRFNEDLKELEDVTLDKIKQVITYVFKDPTIHLLTYGE